VLGQRISSSNSENKEGGFIYRAFNDKVGFDERLKDLNR
jgi:hypothetical protein